MEADYCQLAEARCRFWRGWREQGYTEPKEILKATSRRNGRQPKKRTVTLLNTLDELIVAYKNAPGRHDQRTHTPTSGVRSWQVGARHKWVSGVTITESVSSENSSVRRFTATIKGYRNWHIWQGNIVEQGAANVVAAVQAKVIAIRDRIEEGDESVFHESQAW